jgi:hypothetical protein
LSLSMLAIHLGIAGSAPAEDGQAGQPADPEQDPVGPPARGGQHQDHGHDGRVNHPVGVTPAHPGCRHHAETAVDGAAREVRVPREGGSYEIRVRGRLSDSLVAAFEGMNATVEPVETVLHGPVQDQAALYGLLDRIQALGLELLEVRRLPDPPAGSSG